MRRLSLSLAITSLLFGTQLPAQTNTNPITREAVIDAEKLLGLHFSDDKNDLMLPGLKDQLDNFEAIRKFPLSNAIPSALLFNPIPVGMKFETVRKKFKLKDMVFNGKFEM